MGIIIAVFIFDKFIWYKYISKTNPKLELIGNKATIFLSVKEMNSGSIAVTGFSNVRKIVLQQ